MENTELIDNGNKIKEQERKTELSEFDSNLTYMNMKRLLALYKARCNIYEKMFKVTEVTPKAFINYYTCPDCNKDWTDEWSSTCNDDCPHCGCRHIEPCRSEELEGFVQG